MCGIAGIVTFTRSLIKEREQTSTILNDMTHLIKHRGPDGGGMYLAKHVALSHVRLSIIDPDMGAQPIFSNEKGKRGVIVYNGELYNMHTLKQSLIGNGVIFETSSDTEVVLKGLQQEGVSFLRKMNGIFAFAYWNERDEILMLVRDPMGVKPLFYRIKGEKIYFASEVKALFPEKEDRPVLGKKGLVEVLSLGPAKKCGSGIFEGVFEVKPGELICISKDDRVPLNLSNGKEEECLPLQPGAGNADFLEGVLRKACYAQWIAEPHRENYEETVEHTKYLVEQAVKRQMLSDVPLCTFLSGGLDSSLVTAILAKEYYQQGCQLASYSFDFEGNERNFKTNAFQPAQDAYYVKKMVAHLHTRHTVLTCNEKQLFDALEPAVEARDFPGMADVEASLLYFCKEVAKDYKVAMTGECADEIFGGYPWYHKEDRLLADTFPWATDFGARTMLLRDEICEELPLECYAKMAYLETIREAPKCDGEDARSGRYREMMYLNVKWFMQTLLDRMDRTSMFSGLEARVPFADLEIVRYLYQMPWSMKSKDGEVKGILKEVARNYLPKEVLTRKKSPYPKTYDPRYEALVKDRVLMLMEDSSSPLRKLYDPKKIKQYCTGESNYTRPFYGQLMAGPQYLAYLIQFDYWFRYLGITMSI